MRALVRITSVLAQAWAIGYILYWLIGLFAFWSYNLATRNVAYVAFIEPNTLVASLEAFLFVPALIILIAMMISRVKTGVQMAYETGRRND